MSSTSNSKSRSRACMLITAIPGPALDKGCHIELKNSYANNQDPQLLYYTNTTLVHSKLIVSGTS